jgi:MFS family permease
VGVIMAALMVTLLLEALDQTVVGTAMPRIIATLHGFDRYTWTVTAYLLASTIMLPIAGTPSDRFGRKPFLLGGAGLFLAASLLCGAAQSIEQLIAFRAIQGLGAGAGISLVFAAVSDIVPEAGRARWQGILGSVYGLASVIGPTLGGWLADHGPLVPLLVTDGTRWRWVFLVNLPVGLVALAALLVWYPGGGMRLRMVPVGRQRQQPGPSLAGSAAALRRYVSNRAPIDFVGSVLIAAATLSLLTGLTWFGEGSRMRASPQVWCALGLAVGLAALLVRVERRAHQPVLALDLFRDRVFAANASLTVCLWMTLFGMAFYVPLFLQGVLRASPTTAGVVMTPFSLSIVAGNALAGAVIARIRRYGAVALAGAAGMTAGMALLVQMSPGVPLPAVAAFVVVAGLGMGILFTAAAVAVQAATPLNRVGAGFGVTRYLGQIGGVLGLAVVGTIVNASFAGALQRTLPEAARLALAASIRHGLIAALLFSAGALAAAGMMARWTRNQGRQSAPS